MSGHKRPELVKLSPRYLTALSSSHIVGFRKDWRFRDSGEFRGYDVESSGFKCTLKP